MVNLMREIQHVLVGIFTGLDHLTNIIQVEHVTSQGTQECPLETSKNIPELYEYFLFYLFLISILCLFIKVKTVEYQLQSA